MRLRGATIVLTMAGLWGCDRSATSRDRPSPGPTTSVAPLAAPSASAPPLIAQASAPASAAAANEPAPWLPRAYRNRGVVMVAQNAQCARCHLDAARQHAGSGHQRATVNPAFRAALAIEPTAFCRGCHAPEADPREETPAALRDLGVGCVTCHTDDAGNVHAVARAGRPSEEIAGGHTIVRSAAFGGPGACASCHEFRFEAMRGDGDEHHMQTTVREHARGPFADTSCAGCHMPTDAGGKHDHWFKGVRDPEFLRASLTVSAEALDRPGVRLTLAQTLPGHAFPTGDLFRRLEIGVALLDEKGRIVVQEVRHLARHLVIAPRQPGRKLVADDRIFGEPRTIDLVVTPPEPPATPSKAAAPAKETKAPFTLSWWVVYQRPATVGDGVDPRHAKIESSVPLHRGKLVWPAPAETSER